MKKTFVSSAFELEKMLKAKFCDDIEIDAFSALMGGVDGEYKGERFKVSFLRDNYLLISISNSGRSLLEQLQPVLSGAVGENPICCYDLQSDGLEEKDAMPTIEWDIKDPESRIKEIVNGRAFSGGDKLHGLKLFGDRKLENYVEDEKAKIDRITNARIYGVDKGCIIDSEEINKLDEVDLYFRINAMGGHIWRCRHEMAHGRISQIDLTEEEYAIEYMVYQTVKFGVELPEPQIDKHITTTPSYIAWFKFYDSHFKYVLSDSQLKCFQQLKKEGKDVSAFLPAGNWQDTMEKPIVKSL